MGARQCRAREGDVKTRACQGGGEMFKGEMDPCQAFFCLFVLFSLSPYIVKERGRGELWEA